MLEPHHVLLKVDPDDSPIGGGEQFEVVAREVREGVVSQEKRVNCLVRLKGFAEGQTPRVVQFI